MGHSVHSVALICLAALALAGEAHAWDALWAVRPDAEIVPSLEIDASAIMPLNQSPADVHGFSGRLTGSVSYVDDDKMARLTIAELDFAMIYRELRQRYDAGSLPEYTLFDISAQLRLRRDLHLLYGLALARSGPLTHTSGAGLSFRLGVALPFFQREASTMHEYRRSYLQIETLPLVGSLLSSLVEEGFYDQEPPRVQVHAEAALVGRLETILGTYSAETRLSASYMYQRSMYLRIRLRWVGHTFWRRFAGVIQAQYILPLRPFRADLSEEARLLLYEPHFTLSIGLILYLADGPTVAHENTREQRRERVEQRRERVEQRRERVEQRRRERAEDR